VASLDKLLSKAQEHLEAGETVLVGVVGAYETEIMGNDTVRTGVLAATDRRLVFYAKKMMGYDLEVFPYENISSFEASKGMMGHKLSFFASGNKVVMKWIGKGDVALFLDTVRARIGKRQELPTEPQPAHDVAGQIRQLGELRAEGLITEEEFQTKKTELLSQL
jgi:Bacterial PH domain/Short C-terminal domain